MRRYTLALTGLFPHYLALLLSGLALASVPRAAWSAESPANERARLALWLDTYGQIQGHFSPEQEAEIAALREKWKDLLEPAPAAAADARGSQLVRGRQP